MKKTWLVILLVALSACSTTTVYPIKKMKRPSAKVHVGSFYNSLAITHKLRLCINNIQYGLDFVNDDYIVVPAGERITLYFSKIASTQTIASTSTHTIERSYRARSGVSFIPEANQTYYASYDELGILGRLSIYRETNKPPFEVDIEPTLGKSICHQ